MNGVDVSGYRKRVKWCISDSAALLTHTSLPGDSLHSRFSRVRASLCLQRELQLQRGRVTHGFSVFEGLGEAKLPIKPTFPLTWRQSECARRLVWNFCIHVRNWNQYARVLGRKAIKFINKVQPHHLEEKSVCIYCSFYFFPNVLSLLVWQLFKCACISLRWSPSATSAMQQKTQKKKKGEREEERGSDSDRLLV